MVVVAGVALSAVALAKADDPDHRGLLQKKSRKHKNVATGLAAVIQVALQLCTNNHLTGQNLNEPQNHIYY